MLYVLILYCSGVCPDIPPDGALLFTSLADCRKAIPNIIIPSAIHDERGKLMPKAHDKPTCAHLWVDPKQLERLRSPSSSKE